MTIFDSRLIKIINDSYKNITQEKPKTTVPNSTTQNTQNTNIDFSNPQNIDENKLQKIIDKYSKGKAPLTAKDFIKVSQDTGVPVDLMLAQAIQESNIGTNGKRPIKTKNAWNVGNVDSGSNEYQNSWLDGAYRYANLIKTDYAPDPNNIKAEDIIKNDFKRPKKGGRYATDPNYTQSIKTLIERIRKQLL